MDLTCPSCLAKLKIADSQVPPQGAWARCPKCKEKFVVRSQGQGQGLLDDPQAKEKRALHNLNRPRTPEEERLLKRLAQNRPQPAPNAQELTEMPVIYPEASSRLSPGCVLALVLPAVAVSLVVLISLKMAMHSSSKDLVVLPAVVSTPPKAYDREAFDQDIAAIRRNIDHKNYNSYKVTGVSPEKRALLYLLNSCEPVPDLFVLESIDIEPDGRRTSLNGLTATFN